MSRQTFYCPELGEDVTIAPLSKLALALIASLDDRYKNKPDRRKLAQAAYILRFGMISPMFSKPIEAVEFMRRNPPALTGRLVEMIANLTSRSMT